MNTLKQRVENRVQAILADLEALAQLEKHGTKFDATWTTNIHVVLQHKLDRTIERLGKASQGKNEFKL